MGRRLHLLGVYFGVADPTPEDDATWANPERNPPWWRTLLAGVASGLVIGVAVWLLTDRSLGYTLALGLGISLVNLAVGAVRERRKHG
jgi:hypothetical protein